MKFNPDFESVSQALHCALGTLFVLVPAGICIHHPGFVFGSPRLVGSFTGIIYAAVKEFSWDQNMEDTITRGSNWLDFMFYAIGIFIANAMLFI